MGGSTVVVTAARLPEIRAVVAWVPDASVDVFTMPETGYIEESGQRVSPLFWQQAHDAGIPDAYQTLEMPMYIVQCSMDEYVSERNRQVFSEHTKPQHTVELYEGYSHSSWSYDQATEIIKKSVDFLVDTMKN